MTAATQVHPVDDEDVRKVVAGVNTKLAAPQAKVQNTAGKSRSGNFEDEQIIPSRFEHFLVDKPCCACWAFLSCSLFCGPILLMVWFAGGVLVMGQWGVFSVPTDIIQMRLDGFADAESDSTGAEYITKPKVSERRERFEQLKLVYEVKDGGDIFEEKYIAAIAKIEKAFTGHLEWSKFCLLIAAEGDDSFSAETKCHAGDSVLKLVKHGSSNGAQLADLDNGYGPCNGMDSQADICKSATSDFTVGQPPCTSTVYDPTSAATASDYRNTLRCLCCAQAPGDAGCASLDCGLPSADPPVNPSDYVCGQSLKQARKIARLALIGEDLTCSDGKASTARSTFHIGWPRPGYNYTEGVSDDDQKKQTDQIKAWAEKVYPDFLKAQDEVTADTDGELRVFLYGAGLDEYIGNIWFYGDMYLTACSFVTVFAFIWFGTGSLFLAVVGASEILLSIPIAFVFWGMLGQEIMTMFQLVFLFVILGIGADDIFVFWDAYCQADHTFKDKPDATEAVKFAWALRRARCAMTVTSATTFFSLLSCAFSKIPFMSAFGAFGAMVVVFDYILCITWFAACVVLYNRYIKKTCSLCQICFSDKKASQHGQTDGPKEVELRKVERFFRDTYAPFIVKCKWVLLVVWFVVGVTAISVSAAVLRQAEDTPNFMSPMYPDRNRWEKLSKKDYGFIASRNGPKVPVSLVIGLDTEKPIDRSKINYNDDDNRGDAVYSQASADSLVASAGQKEIYDMLENARANGVGGRLAYDAGCTTSFRSGYCAPRPDGSFLCADVRLEDNACQTGVVCFIDWVRDFQLKVKGKTNADWNSQSLTTVLSDPDFGTYLMLIGIARSANALPYNFDRTKFYMTANNTKLQWGYCQFNTTLELEPMPYEKIKPHYDEWDKFAKSSLSVVQGFQSCGMWSWMLTQEEISQTVVQTISISIVLTLVCLVLVTANWLIGILATMVVGIIVASVTLFMVVCGMSLGIVEAIGLIVVIGLSVDYTVHIAHSYNECRYEDGVKQDREGKTKHALTEMGISVLSGASTTFLAAMFMCFVSSLFFQFLGIFILITVVFSTAASLTLLPALLCTFGPQDELGDIPCINTIGAKLSLCCKSSKPTATE